MDVTNIAKLATSMAETGIRQEVGVTMLKKSMDIQAVSAAQLLDALPQPQSLPPHLGNTINTKA
ncbi:YjfB family protein [Massilia sp. CFBP9012]|uniref:YjfB family protein n=1 Tax=Massilia sp. CFBP9012 TaxID=3096531 RepID=UPI002A6A1F73|nr:YjfB family protein [Massilia sp. CFBP9012]MDY0974957.1 YjfB family protein [Massilia sp. CFBP9012]